MANHPASPLVSNGSKHEAIVALTRADRTEQLIARRARIVLRAADGVTNERTAAESRVDKMTVLLRPTQARHTDADFLAFITPMSAFWMSQVKTWLGILTPQSIRRGSVGSVRESPP